MTPKESFSLDETQSQKETLQEEKENSSSEKTEKLNEFTKLMKRFFIFTGASILGTFIFFREDVEKIDAYLQERLEPKTKTTAPQFIEVEDYKRYKEWIDKWMKDEFGSHYTVENIEETPRLIPGENYEYKVDTPYPAYISELPIKKMVTTESAGLKIKIEGIITKPIIIKPERIQELLSILNFAKKEISSIRYLPTKEKKMPEAYGTEGYSAGTCYWGEGAERSEIELYGTEFLSVEEFISTNLHEIGHAVYAEKSGTMTFYQASDLVYRNTNRLSAPNRFQSGYVESITNPDKQLELYLKSREYSVEILSAYLMDKELDPLDAMNVEDWLRRLDPNFNPQKAKTAIKELIKKINEDQKEFQAQEIMIALP